MDFMITDNLSIQITRYLTERIIGGELASGERILEEPLAKQLGVSRAPVREALQILQKNRLVELVPRRGARVTPLSAEYIEWLYEILAELYPVIVRHLITRPDRERLSAMDALLDTMEAASRSGDERAYFDSRLEYALVGLEGSDNILLKETMRDFLPSIMRIQNFLLKRRMGNVGATLKYLRTLNNSMKSGDTLRGVKAIRELLNDDKEFALSAIRK